MRFNLRTTLLSLIVLIIAAMPSLYAQSSVDSLYNLVDSTKAAEIAELQRLTGAGNLGKQVFTAMADQFRQAMPNVPEDFWLRMEAKVDPREIERMIVPIYDKYLSLDEIRELRAFYSTDLGKKVISIMPQIMRESMDAGRQWGEKIAAQVIKELENQMERTSGNGADTLPKPSEQR